MRDQIVFVVDEAERGIVISESSDSGCSALQAAMSSAFQSMAVPESHLGKANHNHTTADMLRQSTNLAYCPHCLLPLTTCVMGVYCPDTEYCEYEAWCENAKKPLTEKQKLERNLQDAQRDLEGLNQSIQTIEGRLLKL